MNQIFQVFGFSFTVLAKNYLQNLQYSGYYQCSCCYIEGTSEIISNDNINAKLNSHIVFPYKDNIEEKTADNIENRYLHSLVMKTPVIIITKIIILNRRNLFNINYK